MKKKYDVIVIGAGHAGCEASLITAKMGCNTLLITSDLDKIAFLSCSPSIGGMAKSQLVKEIDALGGAMAKVADKSAIQYKTLNTKKGIAVQSTRTQNDKNIYHITMKKMLEKQINLDLKQAIVESLIVEKKEAKGINTNLGEAYWAKKIILTTGTFLRGVVHIGNNSFQSGRLGEFASISLAKNMGEMDLPLGRMKTGTPPRIHKKSINYSKFKKISFDKIQKPFSFSNHVLHTPQIASYIGYTNEKTHQIIRESLHLSSLYSGKISGTSARYCPSFEDKIVRFPHKKRHQIILETESLSSKEVYLSGLGNSFPTEIQSKILNSIKGLEKAKIMRPGYAIEYDYINPIHLKPTLESNIIPNLYMAGQINGTSGYEEAAAQGIYVGINIGCSIQKKRPFMLDRSKAYIGVMIDDLITKGIKEPYRMFTSRAEYRLTLREDNADIRLLKIAHKFGLISFEKIKKTIIKYKKIQKEINRIKDRSMRPARNLNNYLKLQNSSMVKNGIKLTQLLKRNELNYQIIRNFYPSKYYFKSNITDQVELEIKYEGYIKKQLSEIQKFKNLEQIKIPEKINYKIMQGLSNEIKQKLILIQPASMGQAFRIEGMTPAAISVIMIYLKTKKNYYKTNSK